MSAIGNAERDRLFGPRCDTARHVLHTTPWGPKVRVHRLLAERFAEACAEAFRASIWTPKRIDSYACRPIRGSSSPSLHSWGLAWDFFATDPGVPPPGGVWKPENTVPETFAQVFIRRGFRWGRNFERQDWPHIEWASAPPQRTGKVVRMGRGYWMLQRDGAVHAAGLEHYGNALLAPGEDAIEILASPTGKGYGIITSTGGVHTFGDFPFAGSVANLNLAAPIISAAYGDDGDS